MDESVLSEASTTASSVSRSATGPKDVLKIAAAFKDAVPPRLLPVFRPELDLWEVGLTGKDNDCQSNVATIELKVRMNATCGVRRLIPGDVGPYDPSKFTLFCPFLSGFSSSNVAPIVAQTANEPVAVDKTLVSAKLRGSSENLEDLFSSIDCCLPIFFCYLYVALARVDIPLDLASLLENGLKEFKCSWETLLFGFDPVVQVKPTRDSKDVEEEAFEPWVGGDVTVTRGEAQVSSTANQENVSDMGNVDLQRIRRILNANSSSEALNAEETSCDSLLVDILSSLARQPVEIPARNQPDASKAPNLTPVPLTVASEAKIAENSSKILWRNPRPASQHRIEPKRKTEVCNRCEFQLGIDRLELCGISEVDEISISFRYPLFGLEEHKLTFADPSLPKRLRETDVVAVASFAAPTAVVVDTFFHHPLVLRLADESRNGASVPFGVASVSLSKLFDREESLITVGKRKILRDQCVVHVDIEDKDEPSVVLGSLDIWLCLDDAGPGNEADLEVTPVAVPKRRRNEPVLEKGTEQLASLEARLKKEHELAEKRWKSVSARLRAEVASLKQRLEAFETAKLTQQQARTKQESDRVRELTAQLAASRKAERDKQFEAKQLQVALEKSKNENDVLKRQMSQLEAEVADVRNLPGAVAVEIRDVVRRSQSEKESLEARLKATRDENNVLNQRLKELLAELKTRDEQSTKSKRKEETELNLVRRALIAQEASFAAHEESRVLGAIKEELMRFAKSSQSTSPVPGSLPTVDEKRTELGTIEEISNPASLHLLAMEEKLKGFLESGVYCSDDAVILQLKSAIEGERARGTSS